MSVCRRSDRGGWKAGRSARRPPRAMREARATIRHIEAAVTGARGTEGLVLRWLVLWPRHRDRPRPTRQSDRAAAHAPHTGRLPGPGIWSFTHIEDVAWATFAAVDGGPAGIYNVVDDEPAAVSEWRVPRWVGRPAAGKVAAMVMTELRVTSNDKAKRALGRRLRCPGWRHGFPKGLG